MPIDSRTGKLVLNHYKFIFKIEKFILRKIILDVSKSNLKFVNWFLFFLVKDSKKWINYNRPKTFFAYQNVLFQMTNVNRKKNQIQWINDNGHVREKKNESTPNSD